MRDAELIELAFVRPSANTQFNWVREADYGSECCVLRQETRAYLLEIGYRPTMGNPKIWIRAQW